MIIIAWINRYGIISDYMQLLRTLLDLIEESMSVCNSIEKLESAHDLMYEFYLSNCLLETKETEVLKPLDYSMNTLNLIYANQNEPLDLSRKTTHSLDIEKDRILVIELKDCKHTSLYPKLKNAGIRKYKKKSNKKSYPNVRFSL